MDELVAALRAEVSLLDDLHYRITVGRLLVAGDEERFLTSAVDDLEDVAAALRRVEVLRAAAAEDAARELGLPLDDLTLDRIVAAAPSRVRRTLAQLRTDLRERVEEITRDAAETAAIADGEAGRVRGLLETLATGRTEPVYERGVEPPSSRFDERA